MTEAESDIAALQQNNQTISNTTNILTEATDAALTSLNTRMEAMESSATT